MKTTIFLVVITVCLTAASKAQHEWVKYQEDTFIKVFADEFLTFEDAIAFCSAQMDDVSNATMVMVKDAAMQTFLEDLTKDVLEPVWLGGRRDVASLEFKWEDGVSVPADDSEGWNNWEVGYPTTAVDACMVMETQAVKRSVVQKGKWYHTICARRNPVLCQKTMVWSLSDAYAQMQKMQDKLDSMAARIVPVGSIYVEYAGQSSPGELWPDLIWEDVTDLYAGLFFRAHGDDSAAWGETQDGCAPRISQMQYEQKQSNDPAFPVLLDIPSSGWSEIGRAGYYAESASGREGLKFYSESCEVRPVNQAIKLWKRIV